RPAGGQRQPAGEPPAAEPVRHRRHAAQRPPGVELLAARAGRQGPDRARRRHRVDDQGRHPVPRADADARGQGDGVARPRATHPHHRRPTALKDTPGLDVSAIIAAPAGRVPKAFFDAEALNAWWQVSHAVTTPRVLGPYAIEWPATDFTDDILGRLGGVFRGTVIQFNAVDGFFVADAFWLPPDGEPI